LGDKLSENASVNSPIGNEVPPDCVPLLANLLRLTSPKIGDDFFRVLVKGLAELLDFDHVFIAHALDKPATRVRVQASWYRGEFRDSWDYDLAGNPCLIPYQGKLTLIPCDVRKDFENKKKSTYEKFIGIPLQHADGEIYGHMALYGDRAIKEDGCELAIAKLFAARAEAEARRIIYDDILTKRCNRLQQEARETKASLWAKSAELSDALAKENDMRELQHRFISMASHEFRTPLAIIDGAAQRLDNQAEKSQLTPQETKQRVKIIRDAVGQITSLIETKLSRTGGQNP